MKDIISKSQVFMYCSYNDPAEYINKEWFSHNENIKTLITLLRLSIADDLKRLAHGIKDEQEEFGIDSNTEFDFALLCDLKQLLERRVEHGKCTL